jgi:hypothetical protein
MIIICFHEFTYDYFFVINIGINIFCCQVYIYIFIYLYLFWTLECHVIPWVCSDTRRNVMCIGVWYIPHVLHSLELLVDLEYSLSMSRLIRYCILSKTFVVSLRRCTYDSTCGELNFIRLGTGSMTSNYVPHHASHTGSEGTRP